jgi:2-methylcitrate dehydratase PrpD
MACGSKTGINASFVLPGLPAPVRAFTIRIKDGRALHKYIEHAIGSVEVPMTDAQLEVKFTDLADGILSKDQTHQLMEACWNVEHLASAAEIAKAAVPM